MQREIINEEGKIPYTVLDSTDISKVAFAINVQLTLNDAIEQGAKINQGYGPSGCGKSRTMVEIISELSNAGGIDKIYVINPRNAIGAESGMISLHDLVNKFGEKDVVIWDNFPDGIIQRDIGSAIRVLEIVTSRRTMKLLVALKPKYLEAYAELVTSIIPEFTTYYVKYDRGKFRNILKSYGTNSSTQYRKLYENYITQELDVTSQILWQKDPTPLTVLDYFKDLGSKEKEVLPSKIEEVISSSRENTTNKLNAVAIAEKLPSSSQYYAHQFELLNSSVNRQSDVEFLFALKLCYEIGLERSIDLVRKIHTGIFGDAIVFHEPTKLLDTWIYTSGQYYPMHDSCREAIRLPDTIRSKTVAYLCNNLDGLLASDSNIENTKMKSIVDKSESKQHLTNDQLLHSLGLFLGRNIQFMPRGYSHPFLPDRVYAYIRQNLQLENSVGQGIGNSFESLDENLQKIIMDRIEGEIELASGMAESLGHLYTTFDQSRRSQLMTKIYSGGLFARYFGQSLGRLFKYITPDLKEEIFGHVQNNPQFADGIGIGLGYIFRSLDTSFQREILQKAQTNSEISRGLGFGFGLRFPLMDQKEMLETFSKAGSDPEFDKGVGLGLATVFNKYRNLLPPDFFESQIVSWGKGHTEFMFGFGIMYVWLGLDHVSKEVISLMENEGGELAYGASMGYGMYLLYMQSTAQNFVLSKADESIKFDLGLGSGVGIVFKHLPREIKDGNLVLARGDRRSEYDAGLGFGIGFMWQYQNQDVVSESFSRMITNNGFAFGLAYGLGYIFEYLSAATRDQLFDKADKNLEFDIGLGFGLGYKFPYLSGDLLHRVTSRAATRHGFAFGLGRGMGRISRYLPVELRTELLGDNENIGTPSPSPSTSPALTNTSAISGNSELINKLDNFILVVRTAKENPLFIRGFASGLGSYVLMTYDTDPVFITRVFKYLAETAEFPIGLGEGLGYSFRYLPADFKEEILENFLVRNSDFSRGMGIGLGRSIEYVSTDFANKIFDVASDNSQFATGLGIGVGSIFKLTS